MKAKLIAPILIIAVLPPLAAGLDFSCKVRSGGRESKLLISTNGSTGMVRVQNDADDTSPTRISRVTTYAKGSREFAETTRQIDGNAGVQDLDEVSWMNYFRLGDENSGSFLALLYKGNVQVGGAVVLGMQSTTACVP